MKTLHANAIGRTSMRASLNIFALLLIVSSACAGISPVEQRDFDVYPKSVRFNRSTPGSHAVEALVLRNRASQPLLFETTLEPSNAAFDTSFSTCPRPLPEDEECAVFVSFSPIEAGDYQQRFCVRAQQTEFCVLLTGSARHAAR